MPSCYACPCYTTHAVLHAHTTVLIEQIFFYTTRMEGYAIRTKGLIEKGIQNTARTGKQNKNSMIKQNISYYIYYYIITTLLIHTTRTHYYMHTYTTQDTLYTYTYYNKIHIHTVLRRGRAGGNHSRKHRWICYVHACCMGMLYGHAVQGCCIGVLTKGGAVGKGLCRGTYPCTNRTKKVLFIHIIQPPKIGQKRSYLSY